jgi:APA family basic amino acid/polyamine antiporter
MVSRMLYGMSHQKWIPAFFGRVHPRTHTPVVATITVAGAITLLALLFPVEELARTTSYIVLIMFFIVNVSLLRIRIRHPLADSAYQNPLWIPVAGAISSVAMILFQSWS